jgi:hypothetical protein
MPAPFFNPRLPDPFSMATASRGCPICDGIPGRIFLNRHYSLSEEFEALLQIQRVLSEYPHIMALVGLIT